MAREIIVSLTIQEERERSNGLEPRLAETVLRQASLGALYHATTPTSIITPGVRSQMNTGVTHHTGRDRETIVLPPLAAIGHKPMTPLDRIVWCTTVHIAKILAITAAHFQQRSGGHAQQKTTRLRTITASHRFRHHRHYHQNFATASAIPAESETAAGVVIVTATATVRKNEVETEGAATATEVEKKEGGGLVPNLAPDHRRSRPLPPLQIATLTRRTCRIWNTSSWA